MNLETLLEQENRISDKISGALSKLRKWFEEKIEEAKRIFDAIKEKVSDKLRGVSSKGTISKDVVKNGKKLAKKGDSTSSVISKIKSQLSEVKQNCNEVIKSSKDGIKSVVAKNSEAAASHKQDVLKGLTITAGVVGGIGALIVAATGAAGYMDGKSAARNAGGDAGTAEKYLDRRNDTRDAFKDERKEKMKERITNAKEKAAGSKAGKVASDLKYRATHGGKLEETDVMDHLLEEMTFLGEEDLYLEDYDYGYEEDLYLEDYDFDIDDIDYL